MPEDTATAQRRIIRSWRALTGGSAVRDDARPTLLAVSGGADSSALAIALAGKPGVSGIGHVVHDMRPPEQSEADCELVEQLGQKLSLPVHVERVHVPRGNAEGNARTVRYEALAAIAQATGCRYVATGHHADDVLETMLAHLIRGTGPRGLRGPAPRRQLHDGITLVRPMLHATRAQAEAICKAHSWQWADDATNNDPGTPDAPLRAALRARVLPVLEELRPGAATRAARAAQAIREASRVVEHATDSAWLKVIAQRGAVLEFDRPAFAACPHAVREGLLRNALAHFGGRGHDRLSAATARLLAGWMASGRGERTVAGLRFEHAQERVVVSRA